jgi:hypothetical protein
VSILRRDGEILSQRPGEPEHSAGSTGEAPVAIPGLQFAARCTWRGTEAGSLNDFCDVLPLSGRRWGFSVVDVRTSASRGPVPPKHASYPQFSQFGQAAQFLNGGHPADEAAHRARAVLRAMAAKDDSPSKVLAALHRVLAAMPAHEQRPMTAIYATVQPGVKGMRVRISAAGQQTIFFRQARGRVLRISQLGILLGVASEPRLQEERLLLKPGDSLIMLTGSITGADRITSGAERIGQIVSDLGSASAARSTETILSAIVDLRGGSADPKVSALVLKAQSDSRLPGLHAGSRQATAGEAPARAEESRGAHRRQAPARKPGRLFS